MAFRFSLEHVLSYRAQLERQAMVELAKVEDERRREKERAAALQANLLGQEQYLTGLDVQQKAERWVTENYMKALRTDIAISLQRVNNWTAAVDAARKELIRRAKDKKTLEKLKSKQADHYVQAERHREQKEYDETASLHFKSPY